MTKYILIGILLLVIVGGFFMLEQEPVATIEDTNEVIKFVTKTGTVTNVDSTEVMLDGPTIITAIEASGEEFIVAIPSMGIQSCVAKDSIADAYNIAAGDIIEVSGTPDEEGKVVPCADDDDFLTVTGFASDHTYGFEFSYLKGPDGYITIEDNESSDEDFVTGLTLFNKKEYEELQNSTDAREGPPAMHVRVYKNPEQVDAPVWSMRHPSESNRELAIGEAEEAVVGGANAEHYVVDGLYPTDTYVVAHDNHIYVLMGAYLERGDDKHQAFVDLVTSFTFPAPQPAGGAAKINPQVACESALAYMTFPSSIEADDFVASCIAGNHPEVIEKYIQSLGLDGATI